MMPFWRHRGPVADRLRTGLGYVFAGLAELGLINWFAFGFELGQPWAWAGIPAALLSLVLGAAVLAGLDSPVLRAVYEPLSVLVVFVGFAVIALVTDATLLGMPRSWFWQGLIPTIIVSALLTLFYARRAMDRDER